MEDLLFIPFPLPTSVIKNRDHVDQIVPTQHPPPQTHVPFANTTVVKP